MITVAQARQSLAKTYARKAAGWAVAPFGTHEPVILGLQPPTDRQAVRDLAAVAAWLEQWNGIGAPDLVIIWEQRRWPNSGTQLVPVRLEARTPASLARFLRQGSHWEMHHTRAQRLLGLEALGTESFSTAVTKILPKAGALAQEDFERIFDVLSWLEGHPESGLYPRELPVVGIDSKWLEGHATIVRPLHVARGGEPGLGLASPPRLYRVRFPDPSLAPAGLEDLAAPLDGLIRLSVAPRAVLILENLQTLLSLPPLPGVVALHGAGYDVRWVTHLPWTANIPVLYWGDLDADGLNILAALRGALSNVRSVMMDVNTLRQFEQLAVRDPNGPGKATPRGLSAPEVEAFELLRERGGLRLEQERISWEYVLQALHRSLPSG